MPFGRGILSARIPAATMSSSTRSISRAFVGVLGLVALGCAPGAGGSAPREGSAERGQLRQTLSALAADSMMGRRTGSEEVERVAAFLASELRKYGVEPAYPAGAGRDSGYFQRVPIVRGNDGQRIQLLGSWEEYEALAPELRLQEVNVVGILPGADPDLRAEAIVVGAHYDHVGVGRAIEGDSIYNGADDDASGVVAVLAAARALAAGPAPPRTVVFLLSAAEEQGMLGTRWYVQHPAIPLGQTVADLQIEMIGRPDSAAGGPGRAWLTGYERSTVGPRLAGEGLPVIADPRPDQQFFARSDNIAFACEGIPAHTLSSFGMHPDYHGPNDEVERIDFAHLGAVVEATVDAVRLLASGEAPSWQPGGDPSSNPAVCG